MSYTVQRIETLEELLELKAEWEELHAHCTYSSLYNGFTYTATAVETLLKPPTRLCLLTVRQQTQNNALVGIFPFQFGPRKRFNLSYRTLAYVALAEADKPYPVISEGHKEEVWRALADYLASHTDLWEVFELSEVRQELAANDLVPRLFKERGFSVRVYGGNRSPIIPLDEGWEVFSGKYRRMRKMLRVIEREVPDLRFEIHESPADWQTHFEQFKQLEQKSWKAGKVGISKNEDAESFNQTVFDRLTQEGKIAFANLFDGDTLIACVIALSHGETAYFSHVTYDEAYAKYSPGIVTTIFCLKHFQDTPLVVGDFLGGFSHYINRWASEVVATNTITVYRVTPKLVIDYLCFAGKNWIASIFKFNREGDATAGSARGKGQSPPSKA